MVESTVTWVQKGSRKCLKITFINAFDKEQSSFVLEQWKKEFSEIPHKTKHIIIWDCLKMTGYDNVVLFQWKNALNEFKDKIDSIWLISTSNLIRLGGTLLGSMMPFKIMKIRSENEIEIV